eukprot:scaffold7781_cov156-Skeletonema_menzelii.AAC.1
MAAFALNINVVLVADKASSTVQVVAAALSLGALGGTAILCLFKDRTDPLYCIPSVVSWASFFMYVELHNPKEMIVDTFSTSEISAFRVTAIILCFVLIGLIAIVRWNQKRGIGDAGNHSSSLGGSYLLDFKVGNEGECHDDALHQRVFCARIWLPSSSVGFVVEGASSTT